MYKLLIYIFTKPSRKTGKFEIDVKRVTMQTAYKHLSNKKKNIRQFF